MPTGYTQDIYSGKDVTFEDYLIGCSRAFGANVLLRDRPDAPIPEYKARTDFYEQTIRRAKADLLAAGQWTDEEAAALEQEAYDERKAWHEEREAESDVLRQRYQDMLDKALAWEPPTPDHQGLKDFMVEQLRSSIDFDCRPMEFTMVRRTGVEWREMKVQQALETISNYEKQLRDEIERTNKRNAWNRALRESLARA